MYLPKITHPASRTEYELAKTQGVPVMFVVNRTRREGFLINGWYIYKSSRLFCKCDTVDRVIDPMHPER